MGSRVKPCNLYWISYFSISWCLESLWLGSSNSKFGLSLGLMESSHPCLRQQEFNRVKKPQWTCDGGHPLFCFILISIHCFLLNANADFLLELRMMSLRQLAWLHGVVGAFAIRYYLNPCCSLILGPTSEPLQL